MAATVQIREKNGAGETATDKTSGTVRFKNADNATVDLSNPLIIPTSGQEYSYEKFLRFFIGGTGPSSHLTNAEFYMDGTNGYGTGVKLWAVTQGSYATPAVPNEGNDPPLHGTLTFADAFTYTSGSPLSLGTGTYTATNADFGDYLLLCMEVETTATQGVLTAETATFEYDEV